jgi:hypothetical protein
MRPAVTVVQTRRSRSRNRGWGGLWRACYRGRSSRWRWWPVAMTSRPPSRERRWRVMAGLGMWRWRPRTDRRRLQLFEGCGACRVHCRLGDRGASSAVWVGLGGFVTATPKVEQVGTDSNCNRSGRPSYLAWFEVVPYPAYTIRSKVGPGDVVFGSVRLLPRRVELRLEIGRATGSSCGGSAGRPRTRPQRNGSSKLPGHVCASRADVRRLPISESSLSTRSPPSQTVTHTDSEHRAHRSRGYALSQPPSRHARHRRRDRTVTTKPCNHRRLSGHCRSNAQPSRPTRKRVYDLLDLQRYPSNHRHSDPIVGAVVEGTKRRAS